MPSFSELKHVSILPIVDLDRIGPPIDGTTHSAPGCCAKFYSRSAKCYDHYSALKASKHDNELVQCPYGFASYKLTLGATTVGMTGFVPYPRIGGANERQRAKDYPHNKIVRTALGRINTALKHFDEKFREIEKTLIERYATALHEIRKLNRVVKQQAERICRKESPEKPDQANKSVVRIWKSAELMSQQFEIVEVMANEELANLPLNDTFSVYRMFDKVVRIYKSLHPKRLSIEATGLDNHDIRACDKTFPIIATVLVENALRYGLVDTMVTVNVHSNSQQVEVSVRNYALSTKKLDDSVFKRGFRGPSDKEGSGNGLYVAQLVAKQHNTKITISTSAPTSGKVVHSFEVVFPLAKRT